MATSTSLGSLAPLRPTGAVCHPEFRASISIVTVFPGRCLARHRWSKQNPSSMDAKYKSRRQRPELVKNALQQTAALEPSVPYPRPHLTRDREPRLRAPLKPVAKLTRRLPAAVVRDRSPDRIRPRELSGRRRRWRLDIDAGSAGGLEFQNQSDGEGLLTFWREARLSGITS
jgi:hypothetical protein